MKQEQKISGPNYMNSLLSQKIGRLELQNAELQTVNLGLSQENQALKIEIEGLKKKKTTAKTKPKK